MKNSLFPDTQIIFLDCRVHSCMYISEWFPSSVLLEALLDATYFNQFLVQFIEALASSWSL